MFQFVTPWKRQKTRGFLKFQEVLKRNIGLKWVKRIPVDIFRNKRAIVYLPSFGECIKKGKR